MERKPAVAGAFYPSNAKELSDMIEGFLEKAAVDEQAASSAVSYVAPHAGYIYSGQTAAYTYKALSMMKSLEEHTFVVIGPNHTGRGAPLSISGSDWLTPLGRVKNDVELSEKIKESSEFITIDESAHLAEHSVEVQLPFLQKVVKDPRCCFICMGDQGQDASAILNNAIETAAHALGRRVIVIASSDFDHYESAKMAETKDMPAIKALLTLNTVRFNELIIRTDDTACGYGPITVAGLNAKKNGATKGVLLKYSNSGETTGDYESVVAYSSIIFTKI